MSDYILPAAVFVTYIASLIFAKKISDLEEKVRKLENSK